MFFVHANHYRYCPTYKPPLRWRDFYWLTLRRTTWTVLYRYFDDLSVIFYSIDSMPLWGRTLLNRITHGNKFYTPQFFRQCTFWTLFRSSWVIIILCRITEHCVVSHWNYLQNELCEATRPHSTEPHNLKCKKLIRLCSYQIFFPALLFPKKSKILDWLYLYCLSGGTEMHTHICIHGLTDIIYNHSGER